MTRISLALLMSLAAVLPSRAQQTPDLLPGTRVRIRAASSGHVEGRVLRATPDSIAIRGDHLPRLVVPVREVQTLERSLGYPGLRRRVVTAALVGGLAGALFGFTMSSGGCTDAPCPSPRPRAMLLLGSLTAGASVLAVGMVTRERWELVLDNRPR
jgi:hypothetical protein